MNAAIKIRSTKAHKKELGLLAGSGPYTLDDELKVNTDKPLVAGRNARRIQMIMIHDQDSPDVFELFGWGDLPDSIKSAIQVDMEAYRDELLGLFSTCEQGVRDRRKSISYWVKAWRDGACSEQTVVQCLSTLNSL